MCKMHQTEVGLGACWRNPDLASSSVVWEGRSGHLEGRNDRACRPAGPERPRPLRIPGLLSCCWGGWQRVRREPPQRLLGTVCSWGSNPPSALPFPCCLPPEGPWHPDRYWVVGLGVYVCFGGNAGWESVTIPLLPQGLIAPSPLSLPQWWSPWSLVKEPRPTSTGSL